MSFNAKALELSTQSSSEWVNKRVRYARHPPKHHGQPAALGRDVNASPVARGFNRALTADALHSDKHA